MNVFREHLPLRLALSDRLKALTKSCSAHQKRLLFSGALLAGIMAGCAPATVVERERYFWPSPPNPPRIEWLGEYHSQLDLKMTPFRRLKEAFAGEDTPIALKKPVEVRADTVSDKIYVADIEASGVFVFDLKQSELRTLSMKDSGLPDRISPIGMAMDGENNLYVLEPRYKKVLVYDSSEKLLRVLDLMKISRRPVAIAADKERGRLYVSDVQLNKIFVLDLNGAVLFEFGAPGSGEGAFNRPVSIAVGSGGDIIVADSFNARVQIFSESGVFRRTFGKRGDTAGSFQLIKSVAVDQDNNIYVVDGRSHSVSIFNHAGEMLTVLGGFYAVSSSGKVAPGGFSLPVGIDIDGRGRIFIADQQNARIQVFQYLPEGAVPPPP